MAARPVPESFKGIEYEGWEHKAAAYDDWLAQITRQTIAPTLCHARIRRRRRLPWTEVQQSFGEQP